MCKGRAGVTGLLRRDGTERKRIGSARVEMCCSHAEKQVNKWKLRVTEMSDTDGREGSVGD